MTPHDKKTSLSWNETLEVKAVWRGPSFDGSADKPVGSATDGATAQVPAATSGEPVFRVPWVAAGDLRFTAEEGVRFEIVGVDDRAFGNPEASLACMWVESTDGTPWSLLHVSARGVEGTLGGYAAYAFRGEVLVRGKHIQTSEELLFDRVELELSGLRELLLPADSGAGRVSPLRERDDEMKLRVPGAEFTFRLGWEGTEGSLLRHSELKADVVIKLDEPLTFDSWFQRWVLPLQDFVSFATREPCKVESFAAVLTEPGEPLWWKKNESVPEKVDRVDFVRQQDLFVGDLRFNYQRVLFRLAELPDPDATLACWFVLCARLKPSARFITTALTSRMYTEHKLANLTSAAEGYHRALLDTVPIESDRFDELVEQMLAHCTKAERQHFEQKLRFANSRSQRHRIGNLYKRAKTLLPELGRHVRRDTDGLIDTRNYFTHQDEKPATLLEHPDLVQALRRLEAVIQANFLLDLGLRHEWVKQAMRRSYDGERVLG